MTTLSALSTQYLQIPVTETSSGLPTDPTANPVAVAVLLGRNDPGDSDWLAGSWDTSSVNGTYFAQVLIGPAGLKTLTTGTWTVWVKITADPEIPVIQTGTITVY